MVKGVLQQIIRCDIRPVGWFVQVSGQSVSHLNIKTLKQRSPFSFKMADNLNLTGFEVCFAIGSQHHYGVGGKTRFEPRITKE